MSKFRNSKVLSAVLRTIVSEISDDKELTTQFNLVKSVVGDINRCTELNLYLAAAETVDRTKDRTLYTTEENATPNSTQESLPEYRDASQLDHIYSEPPVNSNIGLDIEDNYTGNLILSMCADLDFKTHFGVTRTTVEGLLKTMMSYYYRKSLVGRPSLPMETKLLLTLWMLTTQDTYRTVGERFNLSKGICHRIFFDTCELLYNAVGECIFWPEESEWRLLQSTFKSMTGMPGVIGVIGSCHIPIKVNVDNKELYVNNRGYPSVVLQAICTPDLKFSDVYIGWPGSVHCEQIFWNSDIYCGISTDSASFLPENGHIAGNAAYPLANFLLTPYRGHLDEQQATYNAALSRCWYILRKSFSLLHGRFKRLQCLDMARIDVLPKIITSCCVLHNMILMEESDVPDVEVDDYDIHYVEVGATAISDNQLDSIVESKRDGIAKVLVNQNNSFR